MGKSMVTALLTHGIDFFTLLRQEDGWKIASIAYTSIPASEHPRREN